MTDKIMNRWAVAEKLPDCVPLREMIDFAVERLMELEVGAAVGTAYCPKIRRGWRSAMATTIRTGRPGRRPWSGAFRSCGRAYTSRTFWNPRALARSSPRMPSVRESWRGLTTVIQAVCVQVISTFSMVDPVKAMGISDISKN